MIADMGVRNRPPPTDIITEPLDSLDEIEEFNRTVAEDKEFRDTLVAKCVSVGGVDMKDMTSNVMGMLMTNGLMSNLNMKGQRGKTAFENSALCKAIIASLIASHRSTESDARRCITSVLKYAPTRKGGSRRK